MGSPKVYRSSYVYRDTMAINNRFESKSSAEQRTSKGGMTMLKMRPTDKETSPPGCSLLRHVLRSRPRSLPSSRPASLPSRPDSTEGAYRERINEVYRMVTEADFERRLPSQAASTSQCHYRLQDILYRACRSTARRLGRAQVHFNLASITILQNLRVS